MSFVNALRSRRNSGKVFFRERERDKEINDFFYLIKFF